MKKNIGFIGMGSMAKAMVQGFLNAGVLKPEQLNAYAPSQEKLKQNAAALGFFPCESLADTVTVSDICILCCKPQQIESVLRDISPLLKGKVLLSVAAGWDYERFSPLLLPDTRFQYIMPNTPAMTGEGVLLFEARHSLANEERQEIMELFGCLGMVRELPSSLMGVGAAVTGCGPAFLYLITEAFADAAVKYGVSRSLAYELVSQMIAGSARLQLSTGKHPGMLKDEVCSPGGTTILGVDALEKAGLRAACLQAVDAVMKGTRP